MRYTNLLGSQPCLPVRTRNTLSQAQLSVGSVGSSSTSRNRDRSQTAHAFAHHGI